MEPRERQGQARLVEVLHIVKKKYADLESSSNLPEEEHLNNKKGGEKGGGLILPDTLWRCQVFMSFWSGSVSYFCTKYANVCLMDIIRSLEWTIRSAAEEMIQSLVYFNATMQTA